MTIDSNDNIYIAATIEGTITINSFASEPMAGGAVGLSAFGTITSSGQDFFIAKFNKDGVAQWATRAGGPLVDNGRAIKADASGNVYVAGIIRGGAGAIPITMYSYNSAPVAGGEIGLSAYGILYSDALGDIGIVKYNTNGVVLWATKFGANDASRIDECFSSMTVDANGNLYIAGVYNVHMSLYNYSTAPVAAGAVGLVRYGIVPYNGAPGASGSAIFIAKISPNGVVLWATCVNGTASSVEKAYGLAVDGSGNVYLTGAYSTGCIIYSYASAPVTDVLIGVSTYATIAASGATDALLVKYNSSGVAQWATSIASSLSDQGTAVATDGSGNVYVTGFYSGATTIKNFTRVTTGAVVMTSYGTLANSGSTDCFIVKYNTNGITQSAATISGSGEDAGTAITVDSNDSVYVAGFFEGTTTIREFSAAPTVAGGAVQLSDYGTITSAGGRDAFIVKLGSM
jgi:hypothetical protein